MTGPEGNSEFCFPRISMFPETKTIEIWGKQNSMFPKGPVIKWFVIQRNKTKANFERAFSQSIDPSINRPINQTNNQSIKENQTEDVRGLIYSVFSLLKGKESIPYSDINMHMSSLLSVSPAPLQVFCQDFLTQGLSGTGGVLDILHKWKNWGSQIMNINILFL